MAAADPDSTYRALFPELDPGIGRVLGRSNYAEEEERRVELVASLILQRGAGGRTPERLAPRGRRLLAYVQLYPLWRDLHEAMPSIALDPPRRWLAWRACLDLDHRLYRRAIEILDGRLALSAHLNGPAAPATSVPHTGPSRGRAPVRPTAAQEAAMLAAGLRAWRLGTASNRPSSPAYPMRDHGDLASQVSWLIEVSRQYRRLSTGRRRGVERRPGARERTTMALNRESSELVARIRLGLAAGVCLGIVVAGRQAVELAHHLDELLDLVYGVAGQPGSTLS